MEPGLQEGSIEEQSDNSFCVRFPCGALTLHSHCRRNIRIKIGNLQSMDVEPPPIRSSGNRWFPRLPPIFFWPKHHWFSPPVSRMPIVWDQFPSVHCKTQSLAQMGDTISTLHCCLQQPFYDERMVAKLSPKHSFCNPSSSRPKLKYRQAPRVNQQSNCRVVCRNYQFILEVFWPTSTPSAWTPDLQLSSPGRRPDSD